MTRHTSDGWEDDKQVERAVKAGAAALLIANADWTLVKLFTPTSGGGYTVPVIGVRGSDRDKLAAVAELMLTVEPLNLPAALATQLQQLPPEAMLTKGKHDSTPLFLLCLNSSLTLELLTAALEDLPSEAMLTKNKIGVDVDLMFGRTPLHSLCTNISLTLELLVAVLEACRRRQC